jgi:hypothetical protein
MRERLAVEEGFGVEGKCEQQGEERLHGLVRRL